MLYVPRHGLGINVSVAEVVWGIKSLTSQEVVTIVGHTLQFFTSLVHIVNLKPLNMSIK